MAVDISSGRVLVVSWWLLVDGDGSKWLVVLLLDVAPTILVGMHDGGRAKREKQRAEK
jgi:hypothetical protein